MTDRSDRCYGDVMWQLFTPEIFLLFFEDMSQCHIQEIRSGRGLGWKLSADICQITYKHWKISPAEDGNSSEKLFMIVVGDFLPRLSELWPLNMSLLVSKSYLFFFFLLWLGISHWGQRIPHENCLYSVLKLTAVYRTIKQPSLSRTTVTVLLLAALKNHHAQPCDPCEVQSFCVEKLQTGLAMFLWLKNYPLCKLQHQICAHGYI